MARAPFTWIAEQKNASETSFRKLVSTPPQIREDGNNRWYLFRRIFSLDAEIVSAITRITVDGRYQLFINQQRVSRGPIRCNPEFQRYDEIDLYPYLTPGKNVIALLIHVYGKDTAWYQQSKDYWQSIFGDGGLYFESQIKYSKNSAEQNADKNFNIISDENWKYLKAEAWDSSTPTSGWGQGFIEKFNASKMPFQWNALDYDDSQWSNAKNLLCKTSENEKKMGWNNISPFPVLIKNILKPLSENKVFANKIRSTFLVTPDSSLQFEHRLYEEIFSTVDETGFPAENIKNLLNDNEQSAFIKTTENNDISIVLEFDKLYTGYPFIEIEAEGGEVIEIAVAETLPLEFTDGTTEERLRIGSHLDCKHIFQYQARKGLQLFEKFEWTAVRYLQIVLRNAASGIHIKRVGVNHTHYPLENQGHFHCSDSFLNTLWETGRYTTLLCSHDAWEDCPSREKRQWIGDGLVHYPVAQVCFGNSGQALDKMYLIQSAESQRNDGLLQMFAPGDHHYHGIVIPDFSLHWISTVYHYLWVTDDRNTIAEFFPTIEKILQWFYLQLNSAGMLADLPHWHFIEWANMGREHQATTINALFAGTLKHASFIAKYLGYQLASDKMMQHYNKIADCLNQQHWDDDRQVYIDGFNPQNGTVNQQVSQHANALMIYNQIAPQERWLSITNYITDTKRIKLTNTPPVVMHGETINPQTDVVKCNTFYSHFLYGALAKTDQFQKSIDLFRENYAAMLATGTSTLWESFSADASLCHAFSASPVYYLSKEILGVSAVNPGYKEVLIRPKFCDLEAASGSFPTAQGNIDINWEIIKNNLTIEINIAAGITAHLQLDKKYHPAQTPIKLSCGKQILNYQFSEK